MNQDFYQHLTGSQKKAVFHHQGPLLVLAGPGSGKTRVITYRIAALIDHGVNPHNICAITFTNKAAEEMRQRIYHLGTARGVHISTFHSLCVRILRWNADAAGLNPNFSIYDTSDQSKCIRQAIKDCNLDKSNFPPARMLNAISVLKSKLQTPEKFRSQADDFFSKTLSRIYDHYQQILTEHNALDFDDLLMKVAILLRGCPDVRDTISDRFRYLLVDEYQDTNHPQYQIAKSIAQPHRNICVTGDPDQSIYRWRGADITNILAFEEDWPDATVVKLEENFRSTPNILDIADRLIAFNKNRKLKKLIPTRPAGEDIHLDCFDDQTDEAHQLVGKIKELNQQGFPLRDIAVFYRVNAMSRALEEAFINNQIPYQIVRGVEFYGRKEIRDVLAYLKILTNPDDQVSLLRIINQPRRGIGKTTITRIADYARSHNIPMYQALLHVDDIKNLSKSAGAKIKAFTTMTESFKNNIQGGVAPLTQRVFSESGLEDSLGTSDIKDQSALENVGELINAAAAYDENNDQPSLLDFLQQISLFSDADAYDTSSDSVALMTLHAAKGLEFSNVFIVGLEKGMLPHERSSESPEEMEEERRLLFVGITRAKSNLFLSYVKYRKIRGQLLRTVPSQFLPELGDVFSEYIQQAQAARDDFFDQPFPQEPEGNEPLLKKGQMVRHRVFGLGRVLKFTDIGENSTVVVRFNSGTTKSLMLKYANLTKV